MAQQHAPGTRSINKTPMAVRGVNTAMALILDLGPENRDEVTLLASESDFWDKFRYSIEVAGTTLDIESETRPLPLVIAQRLAKQPGNVIRRLEEFATWLDGASDQEVLQLQRLLGNS